MKKILQIGILVILSIFLAFELSGQDLVYQPKNPAFGGSYLNYSWLLSSADTQNKFKDPAEEGQLGRDADPLDQFTESLNRQILNQLSREIVNAQFGESGLSEGSYLFGDYQIEVSPGLGGLNITIFDLVTGGQTQITVPYY